MATRPPTASSAASSAASFLGMLPSDREPTRVSYGFALQAEPQAEWLVSRASLREGLSSLYELNVDLVSLEGYPASELLGKSCTLTLERDEVRRLVHGIVSQLRTGDQVASAGAISLKVVPVLHALSLRSDCRVFQDKTVPEVLDLVLAPALQPYHRKHASRLRRTTYPRREYIVQYRETDLEFVQRLMAEEGIWYCFEHNEKAEDGELLVLLDSNEEARDAKLGEDGLELPLELDHQGTTYWQAVTRFVRRNALAPTSLTLHEYNWINPGAPEHKCVPREEAGNRPQYEPFDVTLWGYDGERYKKFDTDDQARFRWELSQASASETFGESNVIGLCPGQKVRVRRYSRELDGDWIVTSVRAEGRDARNTEHAVEHLEDYRNTFTCIRAELPLRSPRKARPRVHGIQTARVVGPDGKPEVALGSDDIHTDEHGRVQVKFSWDRSEPGTADATVTCFLRVAQLWSGNGWGFMFLPRIGMEVIVSFIDGDPNRPLITGCVYNGQNLPRYEQPATKTKSYLRTQSSPSGNGFNELCFEDADGHEQVYVHAQRDLDAVVEHDQSTLVRANQTTTIGGNQNLSVTGKRTKEVGGSKENGEENTIHGDRKTTITKNDVLETVEQQTYTLGKGRNVTVSEGDDNCTVADGHKTTKVAKKYTQQSQDQFAIAQGSDGKTKMVLKDNLLLETQGEFKLKNDKTEVCGVSSGKLQLDALEEIKLTCGLASVTLRKDGTIKIMGIQVSAGTSTSSLKCDPAGATLSGPKVTAAGQVLTELKGALITVG